jgi:FkbM family methyltransferase
MLIHGLPATKFVVSRLLWATKLSSLFTFRANPEFRLRFYPSSVSTMMWCKPDFYAREEIVLKEYLRLGDVFVDVGANVGILSLMASSLVGSGGQVFAIEAHPKTVEYLRGNIRLNSIKNIRVIHAAVGDQEGTTGISSLRTDDQNRIEQSGKSVPLRRLESILPKVRIRLLKIDTEGFELFVLRGSECLLQMTDAIYLESWERHFKRYGYSTADVLAFLSARGFQTGLPPSYKSEACENILAIRVRESEDFPSNGSSTV